MLLSNPGMRQRGSAISHIYCKIYGTLWVCYPQTASAQILQKVRWKLIRNEFWCSVWWNVRLFMSRWGITFRVPHILVPCVLWETQKVTCRSGNDFFPLWSCVWRGRFIIIIVTFIRTHSKPPPLGEWR